MIDKVYINEAVRIRKEYIASLKNILNEEGVLNEKKSQIEKITNISEDIIESDMNDITKKLRLNNQLIEIERIIIQIQDRIRPHYEKIENLKKEGDRLYISIKEKYPNTTKEEIEQEILPFLPNFE